MTEPMISPTPEQIRERLTKITPGPWRSMSAGNCTMQDGLLARIAEVEGLPRPWNPVWVGWQSAKNYFKTFMRQEDADFIAAAPIDIAFLLSLLDQRDAQLKVEQRRLQIARIGDSETIGMWMSKCARLTEAHERLKTALGLNTPWPVQDILHQMAAAVDHLMSAHDCDHLGWEVTNTARHRARNMADDLDALLAPPEEKTAAAVKAPGA